MIGVIRPLLYKPDVNYLSVHTIATTPNNVGHASSHILELLPTQMLYFAYKLELLRFDCDVVLVMVDANTLN